MANGKGSLRQRLTLAVVLNVLFLILAASMTVSRSSSTTISGGGGRSGNGAGNGCSNGDGGEVQYYLIFFLAGAVYAWTIGLLFPPTPGSGGSPNNGGRGGLVCFHCSKELHLHHQQHHQHHQHHLHHASSEAPLPEPGKLQPKPAPSPKAARNHQRPGSRAEPERRRGLAVRLSKLAAETHLQSVGVVVFERVEKARRAWMERRWARQYAMG